MPRAPARRPAASGRSRATARAQRAERFRRGGPGSREASPSGRPFGRRRARRRAARARTAHRRTRTSAARPRPSGPPRRRGARRDARDRRRAGGAAAARRRRRPRRAPRPRAAFPARSVRRRRARRRVVASDEPNSASAAPCLERVGLVIGLDVRRGVQLENDVTGGDHQRVRGRDRLLELERPLLRALGDQREAALRASRARCSTSRRGRAGDASEAAYGRT